MNNTQQCNCEEMTCPENCSNNHTHKTFWCEICDPIRKVSPIVNEVFTQQSKYTCKVCKGAKIKETDNEVLHFFCDGIIEKVEDTQQENSWVDRWNSYCNSYWAGNTGNDSNAKVLLEVEEDFGYDFIAQEISTSHLQGIALGKREAIEIIMGFKDRNDAEIIEDIGNSAIGIAPISRKTCNILNDLLDNIKD